MFSWKMMINCWGWIIKGGNFEEISVLRWKVRFLNFIYIMKCDLLNLRNLFLRRYNFWHEQGEYESKLGDFHIIRGLASTNEVERALKLKQKGGVLTKTSLSSISLIIWLCEWFLLIYVFCHATIMLLLCLYVHVLFTHAWIHTIPWNWMRFYSYECGGTQFLAFLLCWWNGTYDAFYIDIMLHNYISCTSSQMTWMMSHETNEKHVEYWLVLVYIFFKFIKRIELVWCLWTFRNDEFCELIKGLVMLMVL